MRKKKLCLPKCVLVTLATACSLLLFLTNPVFAGDVTVTVDNGVMTIVGSEGDDFVTLAETGTPGEIEVQPGVNTTVNGNASAIIFNGTTVTAINMDMRSGQNNPQDTLRDQVSYALKRADIDLDVDLGNQYSSCGLRTDAEVNNFSCVGKSQRQQLGTQGGVIIHGDVFVDFGAGGDSVGFTGSNGVPVEIRGKTFIDLGSGSDNPFVISAIILDDFVCITGSNENSAELIGGQESCLIRDSFFAGCLDIEMGPGDDRCTFEDSTVFNLTADGGNGKRDDITFVNSSIASQTLAGWEIITP